MFIIISGLGTIGVYFFIPETKGIPLEEMAKIFGDTEDIAVLAEDIHLDPTTHEIFVDEHGQQQVRRITTAEEKEAARQAEAASTNKGHGHANVSHVDKV